MLDRDYVRLMAEYNVFMNDKVFEAVAALSDEERKRDRGAFFKSLHGTLDHIVHIDRLFLSSLLDWGLKLGTLSELMFPDFEALRGERKRLDEALLGWAETLQEGFLSQTFEHYSALYNRRRRIPRYVMVTQMFNHQAHHRGQLTTLLSQLGVDIGSTDLPFIPFIGTISEELPV